MVKPKATGLACVCMRHSWQSFQLDFHNSLATQIFHTDLSTFPDLLMGGVTKSSIRETKFSLHRRKKFCACLTCRDQLTREYYRQPSSSRNRLMRCFKLWRNSHAIAYNQTAHKNNSTGLVLEVCHNQQAGSSVYSAKIPWIGKKWYFRHLGYFRHSSPKPHSLDTAKISALLNTCRIV